jgi:Ca-activated chloride channel homolog
MARAIVSILLLVLGSAAAIRAQQAVDRPTLSAGTDLVILSVTVVDDRGAIVTGLDQQHFTVFDNQRPQAIQFFTNEDLRATIGLLVDSSGSMRGRRGEMTAVADAFETMRHPRGQFFTVRFNEVVWPGPAPHQTFAADPAELRAALLTGPAQGMTALYDAVEHGLMHLRDGTRDRKALIVVSDGGDNASHQPLTAVLDLARRTGAVIYTLTFAEPDNRDARPQVLKALAHETGGRVFVVHRPSEVSRAFAQIAREIRTGYTIGFVPPETSEAAFHAVRVEVDPGSARHFVARTRAGYYARPFSDTIK